MFPCPMRDLSTGRSKWLRKVVGRKTKTPGFSRVCYSFAISVLSAAWEAGNGIVWLECPLPSREEVPLLRATSSGGGSVWKGLLAEPC